MIDKIGSRHFNDLLFLGAKKLNVTKQIHNTESVFFLFFNENYVITKKT